MGRTHFSKYKDGSKESGVDGARPIQRSAQLPPRGVFWGASGNLLGSSWALLGRTLKPVVGRLGLSCRFLGRTTSGVNEARPIPQAVPCPRPQIPQLPRAGALTAFRDQPPTCPRIFFFPRVKTIATSSRSCLSGASNHIPLNKRKASDLVTT